MPFRIETCHVEAEGVGLYLLRILCAASVFYALGPLFRYLSIFIDSLLGLKRPTKKELGAPAGTAQKSENAESAMKVEEVLEELREVTKGLKGMHDWQKEWISSQEKGGMERILRRKIHRLVDEGVAATDNISVRAFGGV
jgi:hypothetical protein